MEPRANYFTVGLFVLGLTAALVVALLWLTASQHKEYDTYLVYMNESVSGLSVEAEVKFNGVIVGYVKDVSLNPENSQQVRLLLNIEEDTPINQSTRATLMTQGITGVMFVGLKASAAKAPPLQVLPGQDYPIIPSEPSLLVELGDTLRNAGDDLNKISKSVNELLNPTNQLAIRGTLQHLNTITSTLADSSDEIQSTISNLSTTLGNSKLALQGFSQQMMPSMVESLDRFNKLLNDLTVLSSQLKNNPSMLVRGKAPEAPGPGE